MSAELLYQYRPQGATLDTYIASEVSRTFICGPLGSSKTNASCWKIFRFMCRQAPDLAGVRKSRWLAVRNTYPDLLGTTAKDWLEMFGDLGRFVKSGYEPPTHHLKFRLEDGTVVEAELVFLALDREEHVRKLRGLQLTGAWLNEAKELPLSVVEMVDLRVGRYPQDVQPTWFGIFGDTNAPDTDEWYYRLAEEDKPDGWLFLKQPGGLIRASADSPWVESPLAENIQNLPPGYYTRGAQGKREDWIKVNLANEYGFVRDGKPVVPDYRDSVHCREFDMVPNLGLRIGMDFGLTPAALIGQRLTNGQWRIRHEIVTEDTGIVRFADAIKLFLSEHYPDWPIVQITGDPAGDQRQAADNEERTVFQILDANGIKAQPAYTNDFTVRAEAFSAPLRRMTDGQPGLLLHPDCKVTRKGCQGGYAFKRLKVAGDERYRDAPDKNRFSHPCFVAGTLIDTPRGQVPIETLTVGDLVDTPIGPRRVVFAANRPAEVFTLKLTNGVETTCTKDHPFFTQYGYVPAEALQYQHIIGTKAAAWKFLFWLSRRNLLPSGPSSSFKGCATTVEPATTRPRMAITSIELCGRRCMGQYQAASMSTTKTTTGPTTTSGICSACRQVSTLHCICRSPAEKSCVRGTFTKPSLLPQSGGSRTLNLGGLSVSAALGLRMSDLSLAGLPRSIAHGADANMRATRAWQSVASAAQVAKVWLAKRQASMTLTPVARFAARVFAQIATRLAPPVRVLAKGDSFQDRVFNIEVEDAHCYFANGSLVSNCEAGQYLVMGGGEGKAVTTKSTPQDKKQAIAFRARERYN